MWGALGQVIAGVVAAVVVNHVVKETTGKHIHQHVNQWWNKLRDAISQWAASNPNAIVQRFVLKVVDLVDSGVSAVVRLGAETAASGNTHITTEKIPLAQLRKEFPQLRHRGNEMTYVQ